MEMTYQRVTQAEFLAKYWPEINFQFNWANLLQMYPNGQLFIALLETRLVGVILFERIFSNEFDRIHNVEVASQMRQRHIGAHLIAQVAQDSFDHAFAGFVQLTTKTNGTEKFYARLGGIVDHQNVIFYPDASMALIKRYLSGGNCHDQSK